VIAQHHRVVRSEVRDQALAFGQIDRRALIVVIADVALEAVEVCDIAANRISWRRPHAGARVGVNDAADVGARLVDRAMDHVAGFV